MFILKQPYPFHYHIRKLHLLSSIYFAIIFLFLWLFEPFHVNPEEQKIDYWQICILHGAVPSLIFYVYFFLFNSAVPETGKDTWTVGKEIFHLCILFFLFGIASFLVRDIIYTNPDNWSWHYFLEEIKNTFLGGSLIASFLILLNFYRLYSATQQQAIELNKHLHEGEKPEPQQVSIKTQVKADDFDLGIETLLFARAEGNYVEIFFRTADGVNKDLKRIPLTKLEDQLRDYPQLIRSHRAYLINTRNIHLVSGNAQGYQISFTGTTEEALVSRGKMKAFNDLMQ